MVRGSTSGVRIGILPIIDEEIREGELMGVEQERRDTKGQNRYPEVYDPRGPQGHRHVQEHDKGPHAKVDAWAGKSREEDTERNPGRRESPTGGDITSSTKDQIARNGVRGNTGSEDFECRRKRQELFSQP